MGYETRMIVGQIHDDIEENPTYFSKIAEVDLCKCGHEGAMSDLINKVTSKDNVLNLREVYYSRQFSIRKDKVAEKFEEIADKLSLPVEAVSKVSEELIEVAEGWEDEIKTDSYGTPLRAVPIDMVIKAMRKSMKEETPPYRRYEMALPLLKVAKKRFETKKLYCVLYGY